MYVYVGMYTCKCVCVCVRVCSCVVVNSVAPRKRKTWFHVIDSSMRTSCHSGVDFNLSITVVLMSMTAIGHHTIKEFIVMLHGALSQRLMT
jgi:hypothetical protein